MGKMIKMLTVEERIRVIREILDLFDDTREPRYLEDLDNQVYLLLHQVGLVLHHENS